MRRYVSLASSLILSTSLLVGLFLFISPAQTFAYTCNDGTEFPNPPTGFPPEDQLAIRESNCSSHGGFGGAPTEGCDLDDSFLGLPTWYKYLDSAPDPTGRCNPTLCTPGEDGETCTTSAALPIGIAILEGAIRLAGLVAVVMVFIGAFRFITSQGNPESAKSARMTVINALIGLVIVMVSTAVVSYIGRNIGV